MIPVNIKRFLIILISILCVLALILLYHFSSSPTKEESTTTSSTNEAVSNNDLSLMEAYNLALKEAMAFSKDAKLVIATSADDDEKELAGATGKRKKWNLEFANIATEETLLVAIDNGTVSTTKNQEKVMENTLISPDLMKLDSKDAVEKAKKDFNLKPGVEWANGYHFSIMNNGKQTFMTVTGLNAENEFTQVYYDLKTGDCMGSKVQENQ